MKKRIKCHVDSFAGSIRITPEREQQSDKNAPEKITRRAKVYQWADGSMDVFFHRKQKGASRYLLFEGPFFRVFHGKRRTNVVISFADTDIHCAEEALRWGCNNSRSLAEIFEEIVRQLTKKDDETPRLEENP